MPPIYHRLALLVLVSIAVLYAGHAATEDRPLFLGGAGGFQCEKWSETRKAAAPLRQALKSKDVSQVAAVLRQAQKSKDANPILSFELESWVLGYISGVSSGTDLSATAIEQTILCETNENDVLRRIDGFCSANPDAYLIQAVALVSADIMKAKARRIESAIENAKRGFRADVSCF
jgi:hypothetical protein